MFSFTYPLLWLVVLAQTLVCLGLLRQVRLLRGVALDRPLPAGSRVPHFSGTDIVTGRRISSTSLNGGPGAILFLHSACPKCLNLADSLHGSEISKLGRVLVVCGGDESGCKMFSERLGPKIPLLVDTGADVWNLFGVSGSPSAVSVDAAGRIVRYERSLKAADLREMLAVAAESGNRGAAERALVAKMQGI